MMTARGESAEGSVARKRALVVMVALTPAAQGDLRVIEEYLAARDYDVITWQELERGSDAPDLYLETANADLVLLDLSQVRPVVHRALGAASALHHRSTAAQELPPRPLVATVGSLDSPGPPRDASDLAFVNYESGVRQSVEDAVESAVTGVPRGRTDAEALARAAEQLLRLLPGEVVDEVGKDAAACLLVTLFILRFGRQVGEELAAAVGFPDGELRPGGTIPDDIFDDMPMLSQRPDVDDFSELLDRLLAGHRFRTPLSANVRDFESMTADDRRWLLVDAILTPGSDRSAMQIRVLAGVMSGIAQNAAAREDLPHWNHGTAAISRITRLVSRSEIPTRVGTLERLEGAGEGDLQAVATLGGAVFLSRSIAILKDAREAAALHGTHAPDDRYAAAGDAIVQETRRGGRGLQIPDGPTMARYRDGLLGLAEREAVFALEHPFHFRVLLEVLSDENRRYPAECVLNFEALRHVLGTDEMWQTFVWSRDQLPVVTNLVDFGDRELALIQHYVAFGRTPHTSSFIRLEYDPTGTLLTPRPWWPEEFGAWASRPVHNQPNSVVDALTAIDRQRRLGRLWRGRPDPGDHAWLLGELVRWDGHDPAGRLARIIWDSQEWQRLDAATLSLAELHTGAWIVETLRRRLEAGHDEEATPGAIGRSRSELREVLRIMTVFGADYLHGEGDGVAGLTRSLTGVAAEFAADLTADGLVVDRIRTFGALVAAGGARLADEIAAAESVLARSG